MERIRIFHQRWITLALLAFCWNETPQAQSSRPPNVILLLTDDQGSVDAKCYGATDLHTPNVDRLAQEGIRFTQFYSAAPVCSPSRAGLLTGQYPVKAGMPGNTSSQKGSAGLPTEKYLLSELFKSAGYTTAHIGKWHLGYTPETMPNGQGFDHSFGHMGGCIDNYSHYFYWQGPNRHDLHRNGEEVHLDGQFFPDLMVEEATHFMEKNQHQPFFIYFAMNVPHYPYQGDAKWLRHYQHLPYPRNLYAAFLSTLDERIGKLLDEVDRLHLTQNTIIVYQSDHGHSTEERAHFGGGSAGPYRGAKFSLFEGGIRVPAILRWPGTLPSNLTLNQTFHGCDWYPTLAELCGIPYKHLDLDGRSMVPILKNPNLPSPHPHLIWQTGLGPKANWAVRQGPWKLLGNPRDTSRTESGPPLPARFLVNLEQDPSETTDLSQQHPDILQQLEKTHDSWLQSVSTP